MNFNCFWKIFWFHIFSSSLLKDEEAKGICLLTLDEFPDITDPKIRMCFPLAPVVGGLYIISFIIIIIIIYINP